MLEEVGSYDASYLESVMCEGIQLYSLDKKLVKTAKKADVKIYQP